MERLKQRLDIASQALASLKALRPLEATPVVRDATIQRFEYPFEAVWKAAQRYVRDREGVVSGSPRQGMRAAQAVGLLDPDEAWQALEMTDDRNHTVHTYNEALAEALFARIPHYVVLMEPWMAATDQRLDDPAEGPNG